MKVTAPMLGYLLLCLLHSGAAFAALEAKVLASARSLASSGTASRGELEAALQELVASGGGIIDPALSPIHRGQLAAALHDKVFVRLAQSAGAQVRRQHARP